MLDDQTWIKEHDPTDFLSFAAAEPSQLNYDFELIKTQFASPITNIVFAGMGGSALAAELAKPVLDISVPFVIAKDYTLPAFIGKETLVICCSFSGNTEETLTALAEAETKGVQIAIIAHGGKLAQIAAEKNYPFAAVPACPQPRTGVFYMFRALTELLIAARVIHQDVIDDFNRINAALDAAVKQWEPTVQTDANLAKQIALKLQDKTPIIYGGHYTYAAAYKWKIGANENAKNTAWANALPEFNHNEFIGWSSHPTEKPFAVVDLLSSFEHPRILKRFELTEKLLEGKRPAHIQVDAVGSSALEHILYLVLLGDFATLYLGLLNGVDPAPVELVEELKRELA